MRGTQGTPGIDGDPLDISDLTGPIRFTAHHLLIEQAVHNGLWLVGPTSKPSSRTSEIRQVRSEIGHGAGSAGLSVDLGARATVEQINVHDFEVYGIAVHPAVERQDRERRRVQ